MRILFEIFQILARLAVVPQIEECQAAVIAYRACLSSEATFDAWTLERVVEALRAETGSRWVSELASRYLGA